MLHVTSREQLESFLSEHYWFEDGYVTEVHPKHDEVDNSSSVSITLGYQIVGNYKAGSPRTIRTFKLEASGVKVWTYDKKMSFNPDFCMQDGVDLIDEGLGIQFDIPERVMLMCDEMIIEGPFDINTITKPWVSSSDFAASVPGKNVPLPQDWIDWLLQEGFDVSWRFAESDPKPANVVPFPDYSGWFLQKTEKILTTKFGIFFFHVRAKDGNVSLHIRKEDEGIDDLWYVVTKVIARMPEVIINCGNCTFSGEQWIKYLENETYPV